jgi:quercetin dioxygenase-like cupin family protein
LDATFRVYTKLPIAIAALMLAAASNAGLAQQTAQPGAKVTTITKSTTNTWGKPINLPTKSPEVTVRVTEFAPGMVGTAHSNPFPRYVYILDETLTVDTAEGKSVDFPAGSVLLSGQQVLTPRNKGSVPVKLLVIDQTEAGVDNIVAQK